MSAVECTQVTDLCTVQDSVYGYYPSLPANAFFLAWFAICFLLNLGLGIKFKTWTYMLAMCLGTLAETLGYAGRVILHSNPYDNNGFIMQICCIIMGPAFNSAAIYLTLKHITLTFGPAWSRIKPALYTYIFIGCDLIALVLQAIGGALASTANDNKQLDLGDNLAMAGICWQVAVLFFFGAMTADYVIRRARALRSSPFQPNTLRTYNDRRFRLFAFAVTLAFVTIFTRCVYRIAEFAGGWQNPIMQDQASFIALEGVMILIATTAQTAAHPGFCFPQLSSQKRAAALEYTDEKTISPEMSDDEPKH